MSREDWPWYLLGACIGLFVCSVVDGYKIDRLRADVDFLTTIAETNTMRSERNG